MQTVIGKCLSKSGLRAIDPSLTLTLTYISYTLLASHLAWRDVNPNPPSLSLFVFPLPLLLNALSIYVYVYIIANIYTYIYQLS